MKSSSFQSSSSSTNTIEASKENDIGKLSGNEVGWKPTPLTLGSQTQSPSHMILLPPPAPRVHHLALGIASRHNSVPDLRNMRGTQLQYANNSRKSVQNPWPIKGNPLTRRRKSELLHVPDKFNKFHDDIMLSIVSWLPKKTLARCALVSRKWNRLSVTPSLWRRIELGGKRIQESVLHRIINNGAVFLRLARAEVTVDLCRLPGNDLVFMNTQCRLTHLDLSACTYGDPSFVTGIIERCKLLKCLSLELGTVDQRTCKVIGENINLEKLNLVMCKGLNLVAMNHIIDKCINLIELNIGWTELCRKAISRLCCNVAPTLQKLNISGCKERALWDDDIKSLISRCGCLSELDISDCSNITGCAVDLLMTLPKFDTLSTSRCYGIEPITYTTLTKLQYLNIHGCVHDDGVAIIRSKLPKVLVNEQYCSTIARPTVGIRRTSIWCERVRDE